MRAVAVLLVLSFHLRMPGSASGFMGVDIFFVLSGFLITSLLLGEFHRTGRIALGDFWARRARRLLPALVILLVVVAAVTWLTGTFTERTSVRGDLLATAGYVANWHLIGTSSYFVDLGVDSPLEHTWSLAIEEQFYVLWPILFLAVASLFARARLAVASVAITIAAVSVLLLWLLWTPESPERAYMGTDARIFEPLIGAVGAVLVATPSVFGWMHRWAASLLWVGVTGLIAGLVMVAAFPSSYYRGGAVLISIATVAAIGPLWVGRGGALGRALGWGPITWVGTISYGAYLWHWPVIMWMGARAPDRPPSVVTSLAVIALTFAIASVSYRYVEEPIRHGLPIVLGARGRTGRRVGVRLTLLAVPITLLTVIGISLAATRVPPIAPSEPVMMFVGDSVPLHLSVAMDGALAERGWRLVTSVSGACPVTAETPARKDGTSALRKSDPCTDERIHEQDRIVREADPDLILWWDRWSLSDFLTSDDEVVRSGTPRFWQLRKRGLRLAVDRLSSHGATVVLIATEPPGVAITHARCTESRCHRWVRFQLEHYDDVTRRWNDVLRAFAEDHPDDAVFLSVTDVVCVEDVAPCDDSIGGTPARPDGTHYEGAGEDLVIETLLKRLATEMDDVLPT
jgi:peptidoglycan/LPS O-acetylase OafA/YrhL